jgi:hypothetical protein
MTSAFSCVRLLFCPNRPIAFRPMFSLPFSFLYVLVLLFFHPALWILYYFFYYNSYNCSQIVYIMHLLFVALNSSFIIILIGHNEVLSRQGDAC